MTPACGTPNAEADGGGIDDARFAFLVYGYGAVLFACRDKGIITWWS
jgi:hypothetical protein